MAWGRAVADLLGRDRMTVAVMALSMRPTPMETVTPWRHRPAASSTAASSTSLLLLLLLLGNEGHGLLLLGCKCLERGG